MLRPAKCVAVFFGDQAYNGLFVVGAFVHMSSLPPTCFSRCLATMRLIIGQQMPMDRCDRVFDGSVDQSTNHERGAEGRRNKYFLARDTHGMICYVTVFECVKTYLLSNI